MILVNSIRIAQITDTHLFADLDAEWKGIQTGRSWESVLQKLRDLRPQPDLLLLTGDLSQDETVESYENLLKGMEGLGIPVYAIPGNHDHPGMMREVFAESVISLESSFGLRNWRFLLLSSALTGCVEGFLSTETLQDLEEELQQTREEFVMIVVHHPPLPIHSEWMDQIRIRNSDDLLEIIDRFPSIKIVLFGHIHQEFSQSRHGVNYLGTPSTCVQFLPETPQMTLDEMKPGFRLLTLYEDGTWETEIHRVNPFMSV